MKTPHGNSGRQMNRVVVLTASIGTAVLLFVSGMVSCNVRHARMLARPRPGAVLSVGDVGEQRYASTRTLPGTKLFMTGPKTPHAIVHDNLESGLEIHFYNDQAMVDSAKRIDAELQQINIVGALDAFLMLRPWAFRTDLWRYMILWSEGGVYVDHKVRLNFGPLGAWASLAEDEEIGTCVDTPPPWKTKDNEMAPVLFQAALSGKKHSPLLADAIRRIIENVAQRTYSPEGVPVELALTGPSLLGWAARKYKIRLDCNHALERGGIVRMVRNFSTLWTGTEIQGTWLLKWDHAVHAETKKMTRDYGELWNHHLIYCDAPLGPGENDTSCNMKPQQITLSLIPTTEWPVTNSSTAHN
jgi:hypothetical protein